MLDQNQIRESDFQEFRESHLLGERALGNFKLPLGVACTSENSLFQESADDKSFYLKRILLRIKTLPLKPLPLPHALASSLTPLTNSNIYSHTWRDPPLPAAAPPSAHQRACTPQSCYSRKNKVWQRLLLDRLGPSSAQYLNNLIRIHWAPLSKNRK